MSVEEHQNKELADIQEIVY